MADHGDTESDAYRCLLCNPVNVEIALWEPTTLHEMTNLVLARHRASMLALACVYFFKAIIVAQLDSYLLFPRLHEHH